MFKNYLLVTIRNILKNGTYSFINISGLSIGIACSILILLWVQDELSFDSFIPKGNKLHQVWVNATYDGKVNTWNSVPLPTYEAMKTADANIVNSAVVGWGADRLLHYKDQRFTQESYYVSEEFLEMFEFQLVKGSAESVLDDPYSIVITESTAKALFGEEEPMGKIIKVQNESDVKVTGILKDLPDNSSFQFDFLIPWKLREKVEIWVVDNKDSWGNYSFQVYVELNDAKNEALAEKAVRDMLTENGQTDIKREFFLHPLLRWRLHSTFENGQESGGRSDYVQLFTIIAIAILLIACINFMNLATARSERRAKEVGIRKSIGSKRIELVAQFMGESTFIALVSYLIAIVLTQMALPSYNNLVEKELFIPFSTLDFWLFSVIIVVGTGVLSGSYPAFFLSSFKPVKVLKGKVQVGRNATTPRKVLVVLQVGFSIFLIIGTMVIYQQIQLSKNRELGYQQENLLSIGITEDINKNYDPLKLELEQSGIVSSITKSNSAITTITSNNFIGWPGKPEDHRVIFTTIATVYDYTKTMGIKLLDGRDFSPEFVSDSSAIIVNKAALDIMGLPEPVIGTQLELWGQKRDLIGVVDDVLMGSPYEPVKPMAMIFDVEWSDVVTVRLNKTDNLNESLAIVQSVFEKYNPAYPFEYSFADDDFAEKFQNINLTSSIATIFATLTILITGLGLFGLASFTAEQRTKEIGIRKVLGASIISLLRLISKEFSVLVLVGFILFAPLSWWLLNMYLERYTIRIDIEWWVFPLTGIITLAFALTIVINQAWRAARSNPVNALRSE
ncbi:MAG: ABC transporter permease [Bacteroidota bacterium]